MYKNLVLLILILTLVTLILSFGINITGSTNTTVGMQTAECLSVRYFGTADKQEK